MLRHYYLPVFALLTLSGCHSAQHPDVMGVYNLQAIPQHPSAPLAQLVIAERTATLKTSFSEVTLDYAVENGMLYLQADQNTRMAFRIVHRDTLRMTLAMVGEANYVRGHE